MILDNESQPINPPKQKDLKETPYPSSKGSFGTSKNNFRFNARASIDSVCTTISSDTNFSTDTHDEFVFSQYPKSNETFKFLHSVVLKSSISDSLNDKQRRILTDAMVKVVFPKGSGIILQGDETDYFYVVEQGNVEFFVNWKYSGNCGTGESFGELALLYDRPRAASCIASTDCTLWRVDKRTFCYILTEYELNDVDDIYKILKNIPPLSNVNKRKLTALVQECKVEKFKKGERIALKGEVGTKFHIIREGMVKVHDIRFKDGQSHYVDHNLGPDDYFCERALWNVTAVSNCTTLSLSLETYEKIVGPCRFFVDCLVKRHLLMGIPIFASSNLRPHEISCVADRLFRTYLDVGFLILGGEPVVKQELYIIQTGRVVITHNDGTTRTLCRGDYFGEEFLQVDEGSISKQTIYVEEQVICSVLTKSSIESAVGEVSRLAIFPTKTILDGAIGLDNIDIYRIIGVGNFSTVRLASHKYTLKPYALKTICKYGAIEVERVESIIRGKNIMASINHPFIVSLVSTFQDDYMLYMLLDYVPGGELLKLIYSDKDCGIPTENVRFYAACILEALSHLHQNHICYRNLIPENILIDEDGYCKLANFKYSKVVLEKTHTFCGTRGYLAPEMILCKGHDKRADYWAFGILIYEMLLGANPFYTDGIDQVTLFKRIAKAKYSFPSDGYFGESTEDLISGLLSRKPKNRLGYLSGDLEIRKHAWFACVDFARILKKQVRSPWLPTIKGDLDPSNYDMYDECEHEIEPRDELRVKLEIFDDF